MDFRDPNFVCESRTTFDVEIKIERRRSIEVCLAVATDEYRRRRDLAHAGVACSVTERPHASAKRAPFLHVSQSKSLCQRSRYSVSMTRQPLKAKQSKAAMHGRPSRRLRRGISISLGSSSSGSRGGRAAGIARSVWRSKGVFFSPPIDNQKQSNEDGVSVQRTSWGSKAFERPGTLGPSLFCVCFCSTRPLGTADVRWLLSSFVLFVSDENRTCFHPSAQESYSTPPAMQLRSLLSALALAMILAVTSAANLRGEVNSQAFLGPPCPGCGRPLPSNLSLPPSSPGGRCGRGSRGEGHVGGRARWQGGGQGR